MKDSDALALSSERDEAEKIVVEEDAEALVAPREPSEARVLYDIVHSPSYQVPVLYISLKDVPSRSRGLPPPEQVYGMLVPISFREQMEAVGPMGALSATDHPITSSPAYFVHPCRTAEAMEAVAGGKQLESQKYLLQWIGMVGQSVGLRVPTELAQAMLAKSAAIADDT